MEYPTVDQLVGLDKDALGALDLVLVNLAVARGIPALADLDVLRYIRLAHQWAADLRRRQPFLEREFRSAPDKWRNDIDFFRLGLVCWYVDMVLGAAYREDQRNARWIYYTNPADLFINGIMDTRRGTCGTLALLHVVLGRRIGLPVSLACAGSHFICRFDDGEKTINIEATQTGSGGFASPTDEFILEKRGLPRKAQDCGSDLRALTPREMLAVFVALRGRHFENTNRTAEAERDCLLARYLFPRNRRMYTAQIHLSIERSVELFEPGEMGHPGSLGHALRDVVHAPPWPRRTGPTPQKPERKANASCIDAYFATATSFGGDEFWR